jgi:hypothetical protein
MSRPLIFLDLITLIIFDEAFMLSSFSLYSLLQPPDTSSFRGPNTTLSTLFTNMMMMMMMMMMVMVVVVVMMMMTTVII